MKKTRIIALCLAVLMLFGLAACGNGGQSNTPTDPATPAAPATPVPEKVESQDATMGTMSTGNVTTTKDHIVVANCYGEPKNLHPYLANGAAVALISNEVMQYLLMPSAAGLEAILAESWDVEPDSITFHLREGVKFSNGADFTASDVVFSLQTYMTTSSNKSNFASTDWENAKALDDYTVYIPMKEENALQIYYFMRLRIVDEETYLEAGDSNYDKPVGTGPFVIEEWVIGDHITLVRNENYWGGEVALEKITFRSITEKSQAMIELETGGVDMIVSPDSTDVGNVLSGLVDGVKAVTWEQTALRNTNICFNYADSPCADLLVRKAIASCVDREAWAQIIAPNVSQPVYSCLSVPCLGFLDMKDEYPCPYDLEQAKAYLEEAGYGDGLDLKVLVTSSSYIQTTAQLLQSSCAQIGINIEIETMESNTRTDFMKGGTGFDIYIDDNVNACGNPLSGLTYSRPINFESHPYIFNFDAEGGQEYEDIISDIYVSYDDAETVELVAKLQHRFNDSVVWVPVITQSSFTLCVDNLQGLSVEGDMVQINANTHFE